MQPVTPPAGAAPAARNMRIFHLQPGGATELAALPDQAPAQGFVWISCTRATLQERLAEVQRTLQLLSGQQLVDLHVSDLLNAQLPSRYDYTSQYDLLVFRRLASGQARAAPQAGTASSPAAQAAPPSPPVRRTGPPVLRNIDTSPVGFAMFDQVLLSVHPDDCTVRDAYAARLLAAMPSDLREGRLNPTSGTRLPASPADLMLRVVNLIVDGFLDLRRELSRQLDHWQTELLRPRTRFANWSALLDARLALHELDEVCEDQRAAVQDWIDAVETLPPPETPADARERELTLVRSRDVLEHIERVVHHVRRLEQNAETAVQMHFSVQSHRTNDIMRVLTVLTAIFLPLNLIAGIFGMNFEFIPLVHKADGFWIAMGSMGFTAVALILVFWRKRYLARTTR